MSKTELVTSCGGAIWDRPGAAVKAGNPSPGVKASPAVPASLQEPAAWTQLQFVKDLHTQV